VPAGTQRDGAGTGLRGCTLTRVDLGSLRPTVTIEEAKTYLKRIIRQDPSLRLCLWGLPGIGKSAGVYQAVAEANETLPAEERIVGVLDIRLNSHNPVDLVGIPKIIAEQATAAPGAVAAQEFVRWVTPEMFARLARERWVVFLDELTTAPTASMNAGLEIVWDGKAGTARFRGDTVIVGAANPLASLAGVSRLTAPLANRFALHLEVRADLEAFIAYGMQRGIHPAIISYLRLRPDALLVMPEAKGDVMGWPSPRSWEALSRVLYLLHVPVGGQVPVEAVAGAVGIDVAAEFAAKMRIEGLDGWIEEIVARGTAAAPPAALAAETSVQYAMVSSLAHRAVALVPAAQPLEGADAAECLRRLENIQEYVSDNFQLALQTMFYRDLAAGCLRGEDRSRLLLIGAHSESFRRWTSDHAGALLPEAGPAPAHGA